MALEAALLRDLSKGSARDAWDVLVRRAMEICAEPIKKENAAKEITRRDREVGSLDHFLSTGGWDLWRNFGDSVERTSDRLVRWWQEPHAKRAVLILDGLSLRELPWITQGAQKNGFVVHDVRVTGSELPGETTEFAQALGFASRAALQNDGAGMAHRLAPTRTECVGLPWQDCANLIDAAPNWVFWHEWPDSKVHDGSGAGQGLEQLAKDAAERLTSEAFWGFIERLATGRRVVITSDHGYAATGQFFDAADEEAKFLKDTFKSGRSVKTFVSTGPFVPPVALALPSTHGEHLYVLGRRKWKSQGGYPTLAHGGLSLLEVLSPFVELSR